MIVIFMMSFGLWIQTRANNLPVAFIGLFAMRLRKLDPQAIVDSMISLNRAGVKVSVGELQAHVLAGGHLNDVVQAAVSASKSDMELSFEFLCGIDLAGRNVLQAVRSFVEPRTIICPDPRSGKEYFVGVASDGIRLAVKTRVTVRTDMQNLIGGAGDLTIIARVGEMVVSTIGRAESHKYILEQPDLISEAILNSSLGAGTAWEIVSVDISDVEIRDNVGAQLASEQSEADKKMANAFAETRRAEAIATGQEMKARIKRMQSQLVLMRSTLPNAMATSLYEGNLGIKFKPCPTVFNTKKWDSD